MRLPLLFLAFPLAAHAQLLLNPSFENVVGGSLEYWQHNCIADSVMDGAPGSGLWCAEVEASNPQGCFQADLYQVVPDAYPGMAFSLGGWCRNTGDIWTPTIGFDIGIVGPTGTITPMNLGLTTTSTEWTWLSTTDTLQFGLEEMAMVICHSGFVGGPGFALARFDGIQFFEVFPFSIAEAPEVHSLFDRAAGLFTASCANATIRQAHLLDARGRQLQLLPIATPNTVRVPTEPLPPGIYLLALSTDRGPANLRFAVAH